MNNKHLKIATSMTHLLEGKFQIGGLKFGLDPILGLIPWFGDLFAFSLSLYLIWIGLVMKLPADKIGEMVKNVVIDLLLGAVPVLGDISDFFYKANSKNLKILQNYQRSDIAEGEILA